MVEGGIADVDKRSPLTAAAAWCAVLCCSRVPVTSLRDFAVKSNRKEGAIFQVPVAAIFERSS